MASTISTPTTYLLCSSTHKKKKSTLVSISSSLLLHPQTTNSRISTSIPQLGLGLLAPWNGLRHLGVSIKNKFIKTERKERSQNKGIHASLFGVGAPEALVIGVVALLVFGPKGLAEVARNLGKTLRAFQPTIRELQDVSREFKSTLEREIGLDEPPSMQRTSSSTTASSSTNKENSQTTLDPNGAPQLEATAAQQQMIPQEQSENESQLQDDAPPAKPFNIGDVLVQAQLRSTAARLQEKEAAQEVQSGLEPQPEGVAPTISTLKQPESEQEISSKQPEREQEISSKQPENDQETPSMQSAEVTK